MTLGVWSVCFKADDDMFKGRAEAFYEKSLKDLQALGDEQWESLLKGLMLEYIGLVTSPEPPGITAPPLGAPDVIAKDAARAAARAAEAAATGRGGDADGAGGGTGEEAGGDANTGGAGARADDAATASQDLGSGDIEEVDDAEPAGKRSGPGRKAAKGRGKG